MTLIPTLIVAYAALLATVIWHEFGHMGKMHIVRYFPIPVGFSEAAKFRYGGLIANFIATVLIFNIRPENFFLQLFGLFNWVHFVLYTILGSFNREPRVPKSMWRYYVFDDVPNKLWYRFVPLGILVFFMFKDFYLLILTKLVLSI